MVTISLIFRLHCIFCYILSVIFIIFRAGFLNNTRHSYIFKTRFFLLLSEYILEWILLLNLILIFTPNRLLPIKLLIFFLFTQIPFLFIIVIFILNLILLIIRSAIFIIFIRKSINIAFISVVVLIPDIIIYKATIKLDMLSNLRLYFWRKLFIIFLKKLFTKALVYLVFKVNSLIIAHTYLLQKRLLFLEVIRH